MIIINIIELDVYPSIIIIKGGNLRSTIFTHICTRFPIEKVWIFDISTQKGGIQNSHT